MVDNSQDSETRVTRSQNTDDSTGQDIVPTYPREGTGISSPAYTQPDAHTIKQQVVTSGQVWLVFKVVSICVFVFLTIGSFLYFYILKPINDLQNQQKTTQLQLDKNMKDFDAIKNILINSGIKSQEETLLPLKK